MRRTTVSSVMRVAPSSSDSLERLVFSMATNRSAARFSYLQPMLALVLIVAILYLAKTVIVPLALAILLTFVLTPVVSASQRLGLPRVPAVLVVVLCSFTVVGLVGWIVGAQIHNLASELP